MRAYEFFTEAFDRPYPHEIDQKSEFGDYDTLVRLPDGNYLSIMFNNEGNDEWQVEFYRNNSQEITGEGDAQRIFATVLNAIQKFVKEHEPWRLIFSAKKDVDPGQNSESRAKLYSRLVQRYAAAWGYDDYSEDHGDQVVYVLTRLKHGVAEGPLNEYRDRLLQYVKNLLPTWPEYILKDWLVPNKGDFSNLPDTELKNGIMEKLKLAGLSPNTKWQLVPNMQFTMDMFEPMTTKRLIGRAGGHSDMGLDVPRDKERHATQAQLAQQQGGVRKEPVILIKTDKGYELLEGWHRTIQHFAKYPQGYMGPAYVAVAQGQQGVAEGIDPNTFEELDARIIARAAKQIVPTARARRTPEGYVHVTTEDGLDLYIGAGVADGVVSVNIGSGGGATTSGTHKGAVTEIIRGVYDAAVRKYGEPDTPGELTIDHDAGHGVWQHIADKLGLRYAAVEVKEQGVSEGKPQPGKSVTDAIQKVMPLAQEIWFHGSRATGKHRRNSDTDILVVVPDVIVGDQYLAVVRTLQKLSSLFDNYDIQPTKSGTNIHRIAQEEGKLLWSNRQGVAENFADGKVKGKSRPGRVKRAGASCAGSVSSLRARAKQGGERGKMYNWCANMKSGRQK